MDFDTGKALMDDIAALDRLMAVLSQRIDKLQEPERAQLMRGLGNTMGEMYLGLIVPIAKQHPALEFFKKDPDDQSSATRET